VKFEAPERVWGGVVLYPYPVEGEDVAPVDGGEPRRIFQLPAEYFGYHAATMSCLMFRRSFLELTKIQTEERVCADYYYYVLAHALSGTIIIPRPLTYYRVHGSNNFFTRSILGGQAGPPENLEAINRRLEHLMLDKAIADEARFLAYPRDRYYDLLRNLVGKKRAWRYGKHNRTVRLAFGHKRMISFALTYHPVLRHTLIRKLLKKRR
jgi:hypothetical protein